MIRSLVLAALVALALAAAGSAAATPHLITCSGAKVVRPKGLFVLACADANAQIDHTTWKTWTATGAAGTTTLGLNLCVPNCAASKMSFFPKSPVRLAAPKHGVFTKVIVTYVLKGKRHSFVGYPRTS